jgi:hypothetical protein
LNLNLFLLHWTGDGFHKSSDEETGIVSVPALVSDKQDSGAPGEKVGLQLQAPSKSGNEETLDAKQLLAAVPKTKEELFAYDVDWAIYDKVKNNYPNLLNFRFQCLKKMFDLRKRKKRSSQFIAFRRCLYDISSHHILMTSNTIFCSMDCMRR